MKNELTFIQCSRATIRATVSIMGAEFAETKKKNKIEFANHVENHFTQRKKWRHSDSEMQTKRQRDKISLT